MTETPEPPEPADEPVHDEDSEQESEPGEAPVDDRIRGASPAPPARPGERSNASLFSRLFRRGR